MNKYQRNSSDKNSSRKVKNTAAVLLWGEVKLVFIFCTKLNSFGIVIVILNCCIFLNIFEKIKWLEDIQSITEKIANNKYYKPDILNEHLFKLHSIQCAA